MSIGRESVSSHDLRMIRMQASAYRRIEATVAEIFMLSKRVQLDLERVRHDVQDTEDTRHDEKTDKTPEKGLLPLLSSLFASCVQDELSCSP